MDKPMLLTTNVVKMVHAPHLNAVIQGFAARTWPADMQDFFRTLASTGFGNRVVTG